MSGLNFHSNRFVMDKKADLEKTIAIMATDGFEEIELTAPKKEFEKNGFRVHLVSDKPKIKSWQNGDWGSEFHVDVLLENLNPRDYHALVLPGGVINPDKLRRNALAVEIIKDFNRQQKLIAAICHGPQLLIEADLVKGKNMTSHRALKTDMRNAGAMYEDTGVLQDGNYITAQGRGDVSAFTGKIAEALMVLH
jgi:protease I